MQTQLHLPSSPLQLTQHLHRQLFKGLLISSLGLTLLAGGFELIISQFNADNVEPVLAVNWFLYDPAGQLFLIVIAFWLWSLAGAAILHHLLVPALHNLEHRERPPVDARGRPAPAGPVLLGFVRALLDRLARLDTPRTRFLIAASHELRSPLAAILGYAGLLADQRTPPSAAATERYAGLIVTQAQRMNRLIEGLLSASKLEEGALEFHPTPFCLGDLAAETVAEARQHSGREIVLDDYLQHALCHGDPWRLHEVFSNLIDNALKYSRPPAAVRVSLRLINAAQSAEITVQDQGLGIAEADRPVLFTRFGRIRSPETQRIPGHGLGLYIVKHIVEAHGGVITVRSQPGQGSAFVIQLPLRGR